MHDLIDTETVDAEAELFWRHDFKQLLRNEEAQIANWVNDQQIIKCAYQHYYQSDISWAAFKQQIARKVIIGAENGADRVIKFLHRAIRRGAPIPLYPVYARCISTEFLQQGLLNAIHESILAEFMGEEFYQHMFLHHYDGAFADFEFFARIISQNVVTGVINGAEDMITLIFQACWKGCLLPPARRQPRLIK